MQYLMDTHTLIWITTNDVKLSQKVRNIFLEPENEIFISLASIWEMAIKSSLGKLTLERSLDSFIEEHVKGNDIQILNIGLSHILRIEHLPFYHRDPFDRLIICQAIENNLPVLSADEIFNSYKIKRIW